MTKPTMEAAILDYLDRYRMVSFVELCRFLEGLGFEVHGEHSICAATNLVLWNGVSLTFAETIKELSSSGKIEQAPIPGAGMFVYGIDGGLPGLPMAKRVPRGGYRKPHWLPVCLNKARGALAR